MRSTITTDKTYAWLKSIPTIPNNVIFIVKLHGVDSSFFNFTFIDKGQDDSRQLNNKQYQYNNEELKNIVVENNQFFSEINVYFLGLSFI